MTSSNRKYGIDISFQNVSYSVKISKKSKNALCFCGFCGKQDVEVYLLQNLSGIFKAGELTAIMGASGSGKTTLLNVLAGRITPSYSSRLLANNQQYTFDTFGNFANYVMQKDVLMQTLTVRQTLEFAASMKLGDQQDIKQQQIMTLVKKLKLQKCIDTLVGGDLIKGISGGEKKRTSIAFELISDPQVIFLDEPTSGLDSLTSFIIVDYLKQLCKYQNKTVVLTIHQPNSQTFAEFDKLMLLVEGKFIYQGYAYAALNYFSYYFDLNCPIFTNPADYYMSIIHDEKTQNKERFPKYVCSYEEFITPLVQQDISQRSILPLRERQVEVSGLTSFKELIKRDVINIIKNPLMVRARVMQMFFFGIFVGGLYFGIQRDYLDILDWLKVSGLMFFISINLLLSGTGAIALIFPLERQVFLKEESAKLYGIFPYFLSRNIVEVPYAMVLPLIYCSILYLMVGLAPTLGQFFTFYLISFLLLFTGNALGLMIGSFILDKRSIGIAIGLVFAPMVLFAGFFKNLDSLPQWVGWIQYISPIKYSFIAFIQNQILYEKYTLAFFFNFDTDLWPAIARIFVLSLAFRVLSFFFLWLKKSKLE